MAFFEARNLHKRFGDRVVLEDISLAFDEGTTTGIMGPNGAGKTTCFNVLTGHYRPDRGEVVMDGEAITGLDPQRIVRRGVARSFQAINLFDQESAQDNVVIALPRVRSRGHDAWRDLATDAAAQDEAAAILASVGLAGRERTIAKDLAYGERRALEIALALATSPRILFLDEPTSGLGADGTARLAELVAELKRRFTIVMIEHDMRFLFGLAQRIHVIHWGQVIAAGTPDELRDNAWVRRSSLGNA
ncbi:MAG TPA: ABC transporter ATP-binding protein [Casimicrobiaceae bacterium]|nr:ABC transporter ATP-binding protein [Casimicrobiaceae bacterium]